MAVHDVDMDPVGAGLVERPHFLAEASEIGGQDGGSDADVLLHTESVTSAYLGSKESGKLSPANACEPRDEEAVGAALVGKGARKDAEAPVLHLHFVRHL